jgi:membrane fusion protein, adhesin transport system
MDQFVNNQTSSAQKGGVQAGGVQERSVQKGSDQTGSGQAEKGIAESIARDRRPVTQIGSNIDYDRVTRAVRNLIVGVVALVAVLVGLSFFVEVQEVARARGEFIPVQHVQVIQTPEGGALQAIMVRNDDRVQKGDILAKFRATDLLRDLELADVRAGRLQIEIERLKRHG